MASTIRGLLLMLRFFDPNIPGFFFFSADDLFSLKLLSFFGKAGGSYEVTIISCSLEL